MKNEEVSKIPSNIEKQLDWDNLCLMAGCISAGLTLLIDSDYFPWTILKGKEILHKGKTLPEALDNAEQTDIVSDPTKMEFIENFKDFEKEVEGLGWLLRREVSIKLSPGSFPVHIIRGSETLMRYSTIGEAVRDYGSRYSTADSVYNHSR